MSSSARCNLHNALACFTCECASGVSERYDDSCISPEERLRDTSILSTFRARNISPEGNVGTEESVRKSLRGNSWSRAFKFTRPSSLFSKEADPPEDLSGDL